MKFMEKISHLIKENEANSNPNMSLVFNEHIRDYMKKLNPVNSTENSIELERWRRLVQSSTTPSQLSLRILDLNRLIEWDKSIMKVICHICNMENNEEKLLLCDNCDFGYHTYCFKPKIEQFDFLTIFDAYNKIKINKKII